MKVNKALVFIGMGLLLSLVNAFGQGGRLVYTSIPAGNREIFVMDADGTNVIQLTNNGVHDSRPFWSPDNLRIAFDSRSDGDYDIYLMDVDGTNVLQLTDNTANDFNAAWSPDGLRIAYDSDIDGNREIYVMDTDGGNRVQLTSHSANSSHPSWSPDGSKIVYDSDVDGDYEIYVMNADGTNVVQLTSNTSSDVVPAWSPTGIRITYESWGDGDGEISVVDSDGSNVVQLTDNTVDDGAPTWSPDGSKIAYSSGASTDERELYVMDADGSNVVQLTDNDVFDHGPSWAIQNLTVPGNFSSIQAAIDAASDGDTVLVQPGTYVENINYNGKNIVVGSLYLTTGDTSYVSTTIIDGNQNGSVVTIDSNVDSTALLTGFTITNGSGADCPGYWGGCGGGVYVLSSSPRIENLLISGNTARSHGAGLYVNNSNGLVSVRNVIVRDNSVLSGDGGGILTLRADIYMSGCRVESNHASSGGGLLFYDFAPSRGSTATVVNTLVTGHRSSSSTVRAVGTVLFQNVTFSDNNYDPGPARPLINMQFANVTLKNCILWGDGTMLQLENDAGLDVKYSIVSGGESNIEMGGNNFGSNVNWGEGNLDGNPLFRDAANGDYRLSNQSIAIGAGTIDGAPTNDLDGNVRPNPAGSNPDMGAYENDLSTPANEEPSANAQSVTVTEDVAKTITLAGSDPDGDSLTYALASNPSHGSASLSGNTATYTPTANYSGSDSFTFTVSDGTATSSAATVSITVRAVNDPPTPYFSTNFDDGVPSEFSGVTTIAQVGGYGGLGGASGLFSGDFLLNSTGGANQGEPDVPGSKTVLTLTDLPPHESVEIDFLLAVIGSWDGSAEGPIGPDYLNVAVDGTVIFRETFFFAQSGQSYVPPADVELLVGVEGSSRFVSQYGAYDMGNDPLFDYIRHNQDSITIEWWADGGGWQGGGDEQWAIDNVSVFLSTGDAGGNDPPTLSSIGNKTIAEGSRLSFSLSASDPEGDDLTFSSTTVGGTAGPWVGIGSIQVAGLLRPEFAFDPDSDDAETCVPQARSGSSCIYQVTITVSDGNGGSDSETITITVTNTNPNQPPTLSSIGDQTIAEGSALSFSLSASDADGDGLTYSVSGNPGGSLSGSTFGWTPDSDDIGSYEVTITVSDGNGGSDSETITITVTDVEPGNQPPTLSSIGNKTIAESSLLSFSLSASDADGDDLTYSVSGNPSGSALSGGTFTWTPTTEQAGSYSITFSVSDDQGGSASETIAVTVTVGNRPPIATDQALTTAEDTALEISLSGIDPDGDTIFFLLSEPPAHGTATISDAVITFVPAADYSGQDTIGYAATDNVLVSEIAQISITVVSVNDDPVANRSSVEVIEDGSISAQISASDPEGDSLTYRIVSAPLHGTAEVLDASIEYSPAADFFGQDSLLVAVSDGASEVTAWLAVTVLPQNDPPVFDAIDRAVSVSELETLLIPIAASDPDDDEIEFLLMASPEGMELLDESLSWIPSVLHAGRYEVSLLARDPAGGKDTLLLDITVLNVNQAPVIDLADTLRIREGESSTVVVASDIDGDSVTVEVVNAPSWLSTSGANLQWQPSFADAGFYTVSVRAVDASGEQAVAAVVLEVIHVNQPPTGPDALEETVYVGDTLSVAIPSSDPDGDETEVSLLHSFFDADVVSGTLIWAPDLSHRRRWQFPVLVTDSFGASDTIQVFIRVLGRVPIAHFEISPAIGLAPLEIAFEDASEGTVTAWLWQFGDGDSSELQNPLHVYQRPGIYEVILFARNDDGSHQTSRQVVIMAANLKVESHPELSGPNPNIGLRIESFDAEPIEISARFSLDGETWTNATIAPQTVETGGVLVEVSWDFSSDVPAKGEYEVFLALIPTGEFASSDTVGFRVSTVGPSIIDVTAIYGANDLLVRFDGPLNSDALSATQFSVKNAELEEVIVESAEVVRLRLPEGDSITGIEVVVTADGVIDTLGRQGTSVFTTDVSNTAPRVELFEFIESADGGTLSLVVEDDEGNAVQIHGEFAIGSGAWLVMEFLGTDQLKPGEYRDGITWIASQSAIGYQGDVMVRVWGTDRESGAADSLLISVDFNESPEVGAISLPRDPVSRTVEIELAGVDLESDSLSLTLVWEDTEGTLHEATYSSQLRFDGTEFVGEVLWDSFADLGYGEFRDVRLLVSIADYDTATAEANVTVRNLLGDFDGDGLVGGADLARFLSFWSSSDSMLVADLGPAVGEVPLLLPSGDGILNFEDLLVVAQMWNWSVGLIGVPPPVSSKLAERGQHTSVKEENGIVVLSVVSDEPTIAVAVAVALSDEIQIEIRTGEMLRPEESMILEGRNASNEAVIFSGSLQGPVMGGEILQVRFPVQIGEVHGVTRMWRPDGSLLSAESWRHRSTLPDMTALTRNWPNPFNAETVIGFKLSQDWYVTLEVYDILGRRVRSLVDDSRRPVGVYEVVWDGRDDEMRPAGTGVYLVRMTARGDGAVVRALHRVMLLK